MTEKISNPFKYSDEPELNTIFESMTRLQARVQSRFAEANKIAGLGVKEGFKKIPEIAIKSAPNFRSLRSDTWICDRMTMDKIDDAVRDYISETRAQLDAAEEVEKEILAHNQEVKTQVIAMMTRMGIPASYSVYEYPSSRSRVKKSFTKTAGYMSDLNHWLPVSSVAQHRSRLRTYEEEYQRWKKEELHKEEKERIEKDEKYTSVVLDHPDFVADMLLCQVNPLTTLKSALPGKKKETILYCVSLAKKYANESGDNELVKKVKTWEQYFSR